MLPIAPIRPEATRALTPSLIPQVVAGGASSMGGGDQGRKRPWRDESSHGKGYGRARYSYSGGHLDSRHSSYYSHRRHHHPYAGSSRRNHRQDDDTRRDAARPAPPSMGSFGESRGYDRGMSAPRSPANGTPREVPQAFPSARQVGADEDHLLQHPAASMIASPTYSNDSDEDDLDVEQAVEKLRDVLVRLVPQWKELEKKSADLWCPFTMHGLAQMFRSGHVSKATYRAMARHFEWPRDPLATLQPQKANCHGKRMKEIHALHMHACGSWPSIEVTKLLEDDKTSSKQLCHRVLEEILGPHIGHVRADMAASYIEEKTPQGLFQTMSWPPVLVLSTKTLSSASLLQAKCAKWGATRFFNEYNSGGFTGKAVLCFGRKPGKSLADSYEQAKLLKENLSSQGVAEVDSVCWLTRTEMNTWSRTQRSWAKNFDKWAKHVGLKFVNKADREARNREDAQKKMEQVERIAYQSSHEAAARMREIEEAKAKTKSIRLEFEKKVAEMEADFMKNVSEQEMKIQILEQRLEELRRVTQQEAEECRKEYEQKIRLNDQLLQDANMNYQENLARLREEKDKANLESEQIKQGAEEAKNLAVHEATIKLFVRSKPLNDLFVKVQEDLLTDFSDELEKGHFIRSVGLLDLGYMMQLGLSDSDQTAATLWIDNFRNDNPQAESGSGLPLFEPLKIFPIYEDPESGDCSYQVKEDHPFVVAFRKRYGKKKNPLTQRTQADEMLQYMKMTFSEFKNSTHPANGFHRVVTKCCQLVECYQEGRCRGVFPKGTSLTPSLYQDGRNGFGRQLCRVECSPEQYHELRESLRRLSCLPPNNAK